jgi:uncharacterized protein (TIGR04255 family)
MANTRLPVRITPHALLATLVEVNYTPRTHSELALGAFYQALQGIGFVYERQLMGLVEHRANPTEPLFQGQGISLRVRPNTLVFNCIADEASQAPEQSDYLGWPRYSDVIQQVIRRLHETEQIAAFPSVAVRYINALPGLQLNEQLQMKLPALGDLPAPETTFYRATFADVKGFQVTLSLADNQRVPGQQGVRSVFDITVRAPTPEADLPTLFRRLDEAHTCEKHVFFDLLDPSYLERLQPEYK